MDIIDKSLGIHQQLIWVGKKQCHFYIQTSTAAQAPQLLQLQMLLQHQETCLPLPFGHPKQPILFALPPLKSMWIAKPWVGFRKSGDTWHAFSILVHLGLWQHVWVHTRFSNSSNPATAAMWRNWGFMGAFVATNPKTWDSCPYNWICRDPTPDWHLLQQ